MRFYLMSKTYNDEGNVKEAIYFYENNHKDMFAKIYVTSALYVRVEAQEVRPNQIKAFPNAPYLYVPYPILEKAIEHFKDIVMDEQVIIEV